MCRVNDIRAVKAEMSRTVHTYEDGTEVPENVAVKNYKEIKFYCYIPIYTQISGVKWILKFLRLCFGVRTPSSGCLQVVNYNTVVCCYDKMFVNVAAYVLPG